MKSKNNTTTKSNLTDEIVKAELSRQHFCCLEMAFDCTGCGSCNGRVI